MLQWPALRLAPLVSRGPGRVSSQVDISPLVACTFALAVCGDPARNELVYAY